MLLIAQRYYAVVHHWCYVHQPTSSCLQLLQCSCHPRLALQAWTGAEGNASNQQSSKVDIFWQSLSLQERTDALSISLDEFWARLLDISDDGKQLDMQEAKQG